MTKFIQEARTAIEFGKDLRKLVKVMEDPKVFEPIEQRLNDLEDKLKMQAEAERIIRDAQKQQAALDKRQEEVVKMEEDSLARNKKAEENLAESVATRTQAASDLEALARKLKEANDARDKAESQTKKAGDKQAILDGKIAETDLLKKELQESIAKYNSAIANLQAAQVK